MINLDNSKKVFLEYVNKYNRKNIMIDKKVSHTIRVMELSKELATKLNLSKEEIDIATIIGLLHDIGRFEQAKQTQSYNDVKGVDHADIGVTILFEKNMIRNFLPDDTRYDKVIKQAIKDHNKFKISNRISEKEELFCKLIRDADKLDNFELFICEDIEQRGIYNMLDVKTDEISKEVLEDIYNSRSVRAENIKTILDLCMKLIAFIFDINFDVSFKYIYEKDYINKIIDRTIEYKQERKQELEDVRKFVNDYIQKNI